MAKRLLIIPLIVFALFSPGTMIETPSKGGVWIVLCTGDGMVDAIMMADGQVRRDDGSGPDDHASGMQCDWALHGQSTLAAVATQIDVA